MLGPGKMNASSIHVASRNRHVHGVLRHSDQTLAMELLLNAALRAEDS